MGIGVDSGFSIRLQTAGAAAVSPPSPAHVGSAGQVDAEQTEPSSPRPFHHHHLQQQHQQPEEDLHLQLDPAEHSMMPQQHDTQAHDQQQEQLLGPTASLTSSCHTHMQCVCDGQGAAVTAQCAACTGGSSTSSSDCGSSPSSRGSSGGSTQRNTPGSTSPMQLSPPAAAAAAGSSSSSRQMQVLPQIPQDMPAAPLQLPSCAYAAAAAAVADAVADDVAAADVAPRPQLSKLQPSSLRPKASIASPQTPSRSSHVGRKASHLSSHASGALLLASDGSLPPPAPVGFAAHMPAQPPAGAAAAGAPASVSTTGAQPAGGVYGLHTQQLGAREGGVLLRQASAGGVEQHSGRDRQQQGLVRHISNGSSGIHNLLQHSAQLPSKLLRTTSYTAVSLTVPAPAAVPSLARSASSVPSEAPAV